MQLTFIEHQTIAPGDSSILGRQNVKDTQRETFIHDQLVGISEDQRRFSRFGSDHTSSLFVQSVRHRGLLSDGMAIRDIWIREGFGLDRDGVLQVSGVKTSQSIHSP